ncbi:UbiA family prenyltransferase [Isobaculum melis]|uniref:1,4-dihydroxy-2-naphthoate octaprenyltransferase n=1 Tax=Isobaculum melis TaxID=142588 RepID=A0A1H9PTQ2_9LACT|nr:UbiA family prenyltransferase [Isobaculum melis]SER51591.1 1,4-dihydroxy-2-naphthoate octaprenyltransferase [Isobaculum melis]
MSFKQFWELAEVYTLPLNIFLFLLGISYGHYHYSITLGWELLICLIIIFLFHIAVNIFNNYMDFKNAKDDFDDYKMTTNIIGRDQLSLKLVLYLFLIFLLASGILGAFLVIQTGWPVFVFGVIGFSVGIFYSAGPRPLNSLPIAETVTSLAIGFVIPLVSTYLATYQQSPLTLIDFGKVLLIALPTVISMFCCLLANNTCDLEQDIENGRHTLVYFIGKKRAVQLFKGLMLFVFIWTIILAIFKLAPLSILGLLLLFPLVWKNLQPYFKEQIKLKTFPKVIASFSLVIVCYSLLFFFGAW